MIVFQLSCSIFISLVSRFRAGLKAEIGVFFPTIILKVLENVQQPNFQQKMTVLHVLDKLCADSQILVDIFLNYDCDVNSSNIFERYFLFHSVQMQTLRFHLEMISIHALVSLPFGAFNISSSFHVWLFICLNLDTCYGCNSFRTVNGLFKTAQGVPPGSATSLLPPQEATLKHEAMKCLVAILRSMGDWANKQLRIPDPNSPKNLEAAENAPEPRTLAEANGNGDDTAEGSDSHSEASNEASDALIIEQRRAYKLELQVRKCESLIVGVEIFFRDSCLVKIYFNLSLPFVTGRHITI